jgi:hypothetical protein
VSDQVVTQILPAAIDTPLFDNARTKTGVKRRDDPRPAGGGSRRPPGAWSYRVVWT